MVKEFLESGGVCRCGPGGGEEPVVHPGRLIRPGWTAGSVSAQDVGVMEFVEHLLGMAHGAVAARADGPGHALILEGLDGIQVGMERIFSRVLGVGRAVAGLAHQPRVVGPGPVQSLRPPYRLVEGGVALRRGEVLMAGQAVGLVGPRLARFDFVHVVHQSGPDVLHEHVGLGLARLLFKAQQRQRVVFQGAVAVDAGMTSPFVTFGVYLFIPTIISLLAAFLVLRFFYGREFSAATTITVDPAPSFDNHLPTLAKCSLAIILILSAGKILASLTGTEISLSLPLIALCAAAPVILLTKERFDLLRAIDWPTLVFFAAMFVLMQSVWDSGFFQSFIDTGSVTSVPAILCLAVIVSQFISNVPFVALFLPIIMQAGGTTAQLTALAAGSTIAGNLTILGAASNVIIIQNAEKEGETLTFLEFARAGVPLTIIQLGIYGAWLAIVL